MLAVRVQRRAPDTFCLRFLLQSTLQVLKSLDLIGELLCGMFFRWHYLRVRHDQAQNNS